MGRPRLRLPTLLETVFFAAAAAMAWFAVVPTLRDVRRGVRIDLAARSLADCDRAVEHLLRYNAATNAAGITLEMVEEDRRSAEAPAPVWPAGTDRASFDPTGPDGCSIVVAMPDGSRVLVTAASNRIDHAN